MKRSLYQTCSKCSALLMPYYLKDGICNACRNPHLVVTAVTEGYPTYPIGTQFKTRGKVSRLCTVVDMLTTYNLAGEIVSIRYVAGHEFNGQTVLDRDVVATTIAMGLIEGASK